MALLTSIFGTRSSREIKRYQKIVQQINALEPSIKALSDVELKNKTQEFRTIIQERLAGVKSHDGTLADKRRLKGEVLAILDAVLRELLPQAFAVVREASHRTLGQRHYDVQLIGGMILHEGKIAEMKTGEGKTLMATLAVYLNALSGKGVHVITVNDYLARRDASWMGQIYHALGLRTGVINDSSFVFDIEHQAPSQGESASDSTLEDAQKEEAEEGSFKVGYEFLKPATKREAYHADITYGTNNQFGFDYLRDNIEHSVNELRQLDFNFAIVDEVDSILIDEARTPLIISAPTVESENLYVTFAQIAESLNKDEHYAVDEKFKTISLTDAGIDEAEKKLGVSNIYTEGGIKYVHHLETAVRAKALYKKEVEYLVKNGEVLIVDPSTGRLQPGRRWSEGLHQAIEAKEGVTIQKESRTYASITFQNYFRMYPKLAGMTGTGMTSSEEFLKVYGLDVIEVPTHRPVSRLDKQDLIFQTENGKFKAIARKIKELHQKGQPVLIGTVSIEKNQLLSEFLKKEGVPHALLNAKPEFAEKEGEIVAEAGKKGAVTIATNMAGRGVDIKLGGAPRVDVSADEEKRRYEEIKSLGGLFVLGTERHEARRIDNQLRGRSGRQGDPGETQFFVSLEDDLMRIFANDTIKKMMGRLNMPEDEPIQHSIISRSLESAQRKIEGFHFDSRKHVLEYDDVLNQQRLKVYDRRRKILVGEPSDVQSVLDTLMLKASEDQKKAIDANAENFKKASEKTSGDESGSEASFLRTVRGVMLQTIDLFWIDHLEVMDYMRSSVNLRAYGQRDPLVEYRREGLKLFKEMEHSVDQEIIRILANVEGQVEGGKNMPVVELRPSFENMGIGGVGNGIAGSGMNDTGGMASGMVADAIREAKTIPIISGQEKVGRNDPCPCGSGKKYKKCHGV
ncbi:MAG: preprotein translocase subunit SecA [Candidatus Pacebacteria bacterium]|nr:preprotein translocase subunit SecA [Candidatus Paceibacterota bacterium]MBP9818522.1 preprotein translocase subunit SecA [Candidatus Paceibacterota bacterium]